MKNKKRFLNSSVSVVGILFVVIGTLLLLNKLSILPFQWSYVLWGGIGLYGLGVAVLAFPQQRGSAVFWGSFLFFISVGMIVHKIWSIEDAPKNYLAILSLASGFSFLMLYFLNLRRFSMLFMALLTGSFGVLYYLWQFELLEWSDVRTIIQTYWPVLLILWGISFLVPRKGGNTNAQ